MYNAYIPVLAPLLAHSYLLFQTLNFLVCKMDIPTRTKFTLSETRKLEKLYEMAVFKILDSDHNEGQWSLGDGGGVGEMKWAQGLSQFTLWRDVSRWQCREGELGTATLRWRSYKSKEAEAVRICRVKDWRAELQTERELSIWDHDICEETTGARTEPLRRMRL